MVTSRDAIVEIAFTEKYNSNCYVALRCVVDQNDKPRLMN